MTMSFTCIIFVSIMSVHSRVCSAASHLAAVILCQADVSLTSNFALSPSSQILLASYLCYSTIAEYLRIRSISLQLQLDYSSFMLTLWTLFIHLLGSFVFQFLMTLVYRGPLNSVPRGEFCHNSSPMTFVRSGTCSTSLHHQRELLTQLSILWEKLLTTNTICILSHSIDNNQKLILAMNLFNISTICV